MKVFFICLLFFPLASLSTEINHKPACKFQNECLNFATNLSTNKVYCKIRDLFIYSLKELINVSDKDFMVVFSKFLELPEITCYVHSVSPVKKSNGASYVNCDFQKQSSVVRAVCFATEKRQSLEAMAVRKSPVKMRNCTISKKFGREDIVISKKTSIVPTAEANFDYISMEEHINIASLSQVASDQLVCVKGTVKEVSCVKKVIIDGNSVDKQQCYIVDPSGFIKLVIWGSHVDTVKEGETYTFNKVRVRIAKDERYINTPKRESECVITPADPFSENLPHVEAISSTNEIVADILGVISASKNMCCVSCAKKVVIKGKLAFCENCKMSQKLGTCKSQWYARIYFEKVGVPAQRLRLTAFNDVSSKLLAICGLSQTSSEQELTEGVLEMNSVKITYDEQTNKLIDIDVVDI